MYNHAPKDYICPFCLLVQGITNGHNSSLPSDIVYQDTAVTAFISGHQWPHNLGNTLIVPNEHYENIFDLPDRYAEVIQRVARNISIGMKTAWNCDGISLRQHNEPGGNQSVWHYHLHVIPRYPGDRFYPTYEELFRMPSDERARLAEQLKINLVKGEA